jgi:hypothetical protein
MITRERQLEILEHIQGRIDNTLADLSKDREIFFETLLVESPNPVLILHPTRFPWLLIGIVVSKHLAMIFEEKSNPMSKEKIIWKGVELLTGLIKGIEPDLPVYIAMSMNVLVMSGLSTQWDDKMFETLTELKESGELSELRSDQDEADDTEKSNQPSSTNH